MLVRWALNMSIVEEDLPCHRAANSSFETPESLVFGHERVAPTPAKVKSYAFGLYLPIYILVFHAHQGSAWGRVVCGA